VIPGWCEDGYQDDPEIIISLVEDDGSNDANMPLLRKRYGSLLVDSSNLGDFGQVVGVFEGRGYDIHLPP